MTVLGHVAAVHPREPTALAAFAERSDARHTTGLHQPWQPWWDRSRRTKRPGGTW